MFERYIFVNFMNLVQFRENKYRIKTENRTLALRYYILNIPDK